MANRKGEALNTTYDGRRARPDLLKDMRSLFTYFLCTPSLLPLFVHQVLCCP